MRALDAGVLFRLALGKTPPAARLYRATQEGLSMRQIAETICDRLCVAFSGPTLPSSGLRN